MCLAVPMKVVDLQPNARARVESGGVSLDVSLELVENVSVGDYVLVHVGFALEVLDPESAEETLQALSELAGTDPSQMP